MIDELQALTAKSASYDTVLKWREAVEVPGKNLTSFSSWMNVYITKDLEDQGTQIDRDTQDGEKAQLDLKARVATDQGAQRQDRRDEKAARSGQQRHAPASGRAENSRR